MLLMVRAGFENDSPSWGEDTLVNIQFIGLE